MKRIATIQNEQGGVIGLVHGADELDQEITVDGKVWRFDFDRMFGPLWLRKDGIERKCQMPPKKVWDAFEKWHEKYLTK